MVQMPRAVSQLVTTTSHPHVGAVGSQVISLAVAGWLSQAEDSLEENISLDDNVHAFSFNSSYDSVQANLDVRFSEEFIGESI